MHVRWHNVTTTVSSEWKARDEHVARAQHKFLCSTMKYPHRHNKSY